MLPYSLESKECHMNIKKDEINQKKDSKFSQKDSDKREGGESFSKNLMKTPEGEVRENEEASLQDDSYAFDEDNTDNEEYHDVDDSSVTERDIDDDQNFAL
jgi:hypothetical protein